MAAEELAQHVAMACSRSHVHPEGLRGLQRLFPSCKLLRLSFGLQNKVMVTIAIELQDEGATHVSYIPIHPTAAAASVLQNNPVVVVRQGGRRSPLWDQEDVFQREGCAALTVVSMPFYWPPSVGAAWEGQALAVPTQPLHHPTFGAMSVAAEAQVEGRMLPLLAALAARTGRHVSVHLSMLLAALEAGGLLPSEAAAQELELEHEQAEDSDVGDLGFGELNSLPLEGQGSLLDQERDPEEDLAPGTELHGTLFQPSLGRSFALPPEWNGFSDGVLEANFVRWFGRQREQLDFWICLLGSLLGSSLALTPEGSLLARLMALGTVPAVVTLMLWPDSWLQRREALLCVALACFGGVLALTAAQRAVTNLAGWGVLLFLVRSAGLDFLMLSPHLLQVRMRHAVRVQLLNLFLTLHALPAVCGALGPRVDAVHTALLALGLAASTAISLRQLWWKEQLARARFRCTAGRPFPAIGYGAGFDSSLMASSMLAGAEVHLATGNAPSPASEHPTPL